MRFDNDSHYSTRLRTTALVAAVSVSLGLVGACSGSGDEAPTDKIMVIATTSILGDVVSRLGGDEIELQVMIPRGVDPHDFSPSAQQVAAISSADLIVANGLELEEGLEDVLAQAKSEGITVIEVGEEVDPRPSGEEEGDGHGAFDPHFWQDPIRMKAAVDVISLWLVTVGVAEATDLTAEYQDQIDATYADIVSILDVIPSERRLLVTNHDAFGYFADRYGFEVIGTIIPGGSTLAEPSSAEIAALVETIIANDVPAIFVENIGSVGLADILAAETGTDIEVVQLVSDALGEPGSETGTYLGMLIHNASAIADALSE
ncbi:MAG TPA: metal ABC transporter substrate-binding protein [Acidimicrobiia bacterium]|nr:metal ABC transporter substrate-binding protein [Acidimicrobiia bacterium]